ncbi:MAG: sigma 54-interacting transcriptional regulator, partial [Stellaceae bacterium]
MKALQQRQKPQFLQIWHRRSIMPDRALIVDFDRREQATRPAPALPGMVGSSPVLIAALELVSKAARAEANILICGESGTGKELVAKGIHLQSRRAEGAFVAVECAALPENLLETELFGYDKGAFTGAVAAKPGLMELADGGTLMLDEVGELPLSLQAKLLRAIQEQEHRRVGGRENIKFNVRVVAATN